MSNAPGNIAPVREEGFDNLLLNAGVFIKNLDYSSIADADALLAAIEAAIAGDNGILGMTRGGGSFKVAREIRNVQADGIRYPWKGGKFVDSADPSLSTTLIEQTADNLKAALGSCTVTSSGKKTTIRMNTAIQAADYIDVLTWYGSLMDGRMVAITLFNAFNTADVNITFTDKGEATSPVEFHAHQENVNDYDYAPFEVVIFEPSGTLGEITVTSAEGASVGGTVLSTTNVLASGQKYVYKTNGTSTAPSIGYREEPDYTWTEWNGSSEIAIGAANDGKKLTLAVINSQNKVVKTGAVTLDVKTA